MQSALRPALCTILAIASTASLGLAQDEIHEAAQQRLPSSELRIDDQGRLQISIVGSAESAVPVFGGAQQFYQNSGVAGFLGFLVTGSTDFVSTVHAESLFARWRAEASTDLAALILRGLAEDASLIQNHLGLLAARADAARGTEGASDRLGRFAIPGRRELPPLNESIALVPANSTALIVIDQDRLPPSHIGRFGETLGIEVTAQAIAESGADLGNLPPEALIQAHRLAALPALAPFAWGNEVGNFRVQRTVAGFIPSQTDYAVWIHHEGTFDLPRWTTALRRFGSNLRQGEGSTSATFPIMGGSEIHVTPETLIVEWKLFARDIEFTTEPFGADQAARLAESIDPADGLTAIVLREIPDVGEENRPLVPTRFTVRSIADANGNPSHRMRCVWTGSQPEHAKLLHELCVEAAENAPGLGLQFSTEDNEVRVEVDVSGWLAPALAGSMSRLFTN
ncbi:MAG: hypothetical protein AAF196_05330 [Planctomycetota bacterium]